MKALLRGKKISICILESSTYVYEKQYLVYVLMYSKVAFTVVENKVQLF